MKDKQLGPIIAALLASVALFIISCSSAEKLEWARSGNPIVEATYLVTVDGGEHGFAQLLNWDSEKGWVYTDTVADTHELIPFENPEDITAWVLAPKSE